jgi:hypothetical protein
MKVVAQGDLLAIVELDGLYSFPEGGFEGVYARARCLPRIVAENTCRHAKRRAYISSEVNFASYALRVE